MSYSSHIAGFRATGIDKTVLSEMYDILRNLGEDAPAQSIEDILNVISERERRVVVFGDFNRGKSTLLNAIIGRRVLVSKLVPTTGSATQLRWGETAEIRVEWKDGRSDRRPLEDLETFSVLDSNGSAREGIKRVVVVLPSAVLKPGVILVDTPGVNEASTQTETAERTLRTADLIIWLLDARECLKEHERELATNWIESHPGVPIVPVVNFMNLVSEEEDRQDIRNRLENWLAENLSEQVAQLRMRYECSYFEVNARGALRFVCDGQPNPNDDFDILQGMVAGMGRAEGAEVARCSRRSQLHGVCKSVLKRSREKIRFLNEQLRDVSCARKSKLSQLKDMRQDLRKSVDVHLDRLLLDWQKHIAAVIDSIHFTSATEDTIWERMSLCLSKKARRELGEKASRAFVDIVRDAVRKIETAITEELISISDSYQFGFCRGDFEIRVGSPALVSFFLEKCLPESHTSGVFGLGVGRELCISCLFCFPVGPIFYGDILLIMSATAAPKSVYLQQFRRIAVAAWPTTSSELISESTAAYRSGAERLFRELDAEIRIEESPLDKEAAAKRELSERQQLESLLQKVCSAY